MAKSRRLVAGLTCLGLLAAAAVCLFWWKPWVSEPPFFVEFLKGRIVFRDGREPAVVDLAYGTDLGELTSFFLLKPEGRTVPKWSPKYEFEITYKDGSSKRFLVSDHGTWTSGRGEARVHGDLELFIQVLPVSRMLALLGSADETERESGQRLLEAGSDEWINALLKALKSENRYQQRQAARRLRILVSPWARGRNWYLGKFRQVARPTAHPRAADVRRALIETIRSLRRACDQEEAAAEDPLDAPSSRLLGALMDVCDCLKEVGDLETAQELAEIMAAEKRYLFLEQLTRCMEYIHGLPPVYRRDQSKCGFGKTQEYYRRFRVKEDRRAAKLRDVLLAWHQKHAGGSQEQRTRAVLTEWDRRLAGNMRRLSSPFVSLEPLIRLDGPALPLIKRRQAAARSLNQRAGYAFVVARLDGSLDDKLIRELLGGNAMQKVMACHIICASRSKEWKQELDDLQYSQGFENCDSVAQAASGTLWLCHGETVLPLLKKALAHNNRNWVAKIYIGSSKLLEKRQ